jgi:CubicO group peptidase (beta-lactamase class C family)
VAYSFSQGESDGINFTENAGFSSERLKRIGPMMQGYVDRKELPGLVTLIARKGKIVHFEKFGLMDIETNKPMQADTIFRIYSMTKPITAVAAMMLYLATLYYQTESRELATLDPPEVGDYTTPYACQSLST